MSAGGMLPDLMLETMSPRVIGLSTHERLAPAYSSALTNHYNKRGCIVIDMDQQIEPVMAAMPMMVNPEMWNAIRMELLRSIVFQVSQIDKPVVFLNLRKGQETTFVNDALGNSSLFHLLTNESEPMDNCALPFLDITQMYSHVLDSIL